MDNPLHSAILHTLYSIYHPARNFRDTIFKDFTHLLKNLVSEFSLWVHVCTHRAHICEMSGETNLQIICTIQWLTEVWSIDVRYISTWPQPWIQGSSVQFHIATPLSVKSHPLKNSSVQIIWIIIGEQFDISLEILALFAILYSWNRILLWHSTYDSAKISFYANIYTDSVAMCLIALCCKCGLHKSRNVSN